MWKHHNQVDVQLQVIAVVATMEKTKALNQHELKIYYKTLTNKNEMNECKIEYV